MRTGKFRDYENYIIYEDGNILSKNHNKMITHKRMRDGYYRTELYKKTEPKRRMYNVHRIIAEVFVDNPNPDEYKIVNHKDGDKSNNHANNLEWCNQRMNIKHAHKTGLTKNKRSKLKKISILNIDTSEVIIAKNIVECSKILNVSQSRIRNCLYYNENSIIKGKFKVSRYTETFND